MSRVNTPPRVGTGCRFFKAEMSGFRSHREGAPYPSDKAYRMKAAHLSLQLLIHSSFHPRNQSSTHPPICSLNFSYGNPAPGTQIQQWLRWTWCCLWGVEGKEVLGEGKRKGTQVSRRPHPLIKPFPQAVPSWSLLVVTGIKWNITRSFWTNQLTL